MNNKQTLVILTPGFPDSEADSTCLPMQQQLVKALKKNDPTPDIIILSFQYPYHRTKYTWHGVRVIPFNGQNKGGIPRLILRQKILTILDSLHRESPITAILSFWYGECAAIGNLFANKNSLRHFCWVLGQDAKKENKYPKRVDLEAGELIALSDAVSTGFEKNHHIRPMHLITPGIDTSLFDTTKKEKNIDVLGVGSLIPLKQYAIFIEVVAGIKKQVPGIKAELVGKGPEKEKLSALIDRLGLQDNILLTGELPYREVLNRMQSAKIFLHPSSYEGFSGVCMEALYAGAYVISFCRPMSMDIEQWYIASSKEEMIAQAGRILQDHSLAPKSVLFCSIEETAKKMSALLFQSK